MTYGKKKISRVFICCCSDYQRIPLSNLKVFYGSAQKAKVEVELLSDLCQEALENPKKLKDRLQEPGTLLGACFPRAIKSLLNQIHCTILSIIDLRSSSIKEIIQQVNWPASEEVEISLPLAKPGPAWYPLLDLERCNHCGQCLDFCLFGVYKRHKGQIQVTEPRSCKDNCPACARVCPEKAIIFPKFGESPFHGGLEGLDDGWSPPDLKKIFDENLYLRLSARRRKKQKNKVNG